MRFAKLAVAGMLGLSCVAAHAQNFLSKPIRIVIGFPPGGGIDLVVARILAAKMTESLGKQVIVENKPGANGVIATGYRSGGHHAGAVRRLHEVGVGQVGRVIKEANIRPE